MPETDPGDTGSLPDTGEPFVQLTCGDCGMAHSVYCVTDHAAPENVSDAFDTIFDLIDAQADPGAIIIVPPGDYRLDRPALVRHDFLTIAGQGAGFQTGTGEGGGSRIRIEGAAGIRVERDAGGPRIRSLTVRDLLLDGQAAGDGRVGIDIQQDSDNVVLDGLAIKECGIGVALRACDAAHIRGCMVLENTACIALLGGIASIVSGNRMGAKPAGITLFAENQDRLVVSANNIFPDGYANLVLKNVRWSTVTGNQFQSYYTGLLHLEGGCEHNTVSGNQFVSTLGPSGSWNDDPAVERRLDWGLVRIEGRGNLFSGNTVVSQGNEAHALIVVRGAAHTVADCKLAWPDGAAVTAVVVEEGAGSDASAVLDTCTSSDLSRGLSAEVRFRALPEPT